MKDDARMRSLGEFLKDAYRLSKPYFTRSDERWSAWGLLIAIVVMNLSLVGMSVILNFWHREFYNALQDKDWVAFVQLLTWYRFTPSGWMPAGVMWTLCRTVSAFSLKAGGLVSACMTTPMC